MQKLLMVLIGFLTLIAMFIIGVDLIPRSMTSDAPLIINKEITYTEFLESNFVVNPNFDDASPQPWLISPSNKGTATITDNYLHASIANTQFKSVYQFVESNVNQNDYIYISFDYRITNLVDPYLTLTLGNGGQLNPRIYDTDDEWHTYSIVTRSGALYGGHIIVSISSSDLIYPYDDTTLTMDLDNIQMVNLTTLFGSGSEPSQDLLLARINILESQGDYFYEGWDLFVLIMLSVSVVSFAFFLYLYSTGGQYE